MLYAFFYLTLKIFFVTCVIQRKTRAQAHRNWSDGLRDFFGVKMIKLEGSAPANEPRTIFLLNHRSHADFYLHDIVTEYKCSFLSRLAVGVVFPQFYFLPDNTVWFFRRDKKTDPEKFNSWIDSMFVKSPRTSLLVYP